MSLNFNKSSSRNLVNVKLVIEMRVTFLLENINLKSISL